MGLHGSRLWAIDCHVESGAKCWLWSKDIDSFVNLYISIPFHERHAYEVIPPYTPCRMMYDLDMCVEGGLNKDEDHAKMVNDISEFAMNIFSV